jgi:hydrogenase/urease accessory protein HupE
MAFNLTQFGLSHGFTFGHAILEILIKLRHNFRTGFVFSIPKTGNY